ncbi:ribonuclease Z [Yinghuangia sp. ASG 101]|uniref:ribonuclease Z n=1 Tax=Yinghuangia sp. ASG 101 TaxID=2896848 RepID=UPI001E2E78D5|nr:ribonuclease Z [Yinghuangia sp. ASG 101]UGQ09851.1 ribonuclease Z [Yinghuangia sp. ASG 101]
MSTRELVVLGTASQAPTRHRNHNGYLLRWDREGLLFDPGEGTQRQMLYAGVAASDITRICVTHFHGDHCLGLPGVIQRMSLDRVAHEVTAYFPASGRRFFDRLRHASVFHEQTVLREQPLDGAAVALPLPGLMLEARRLSHPVESYGFRLAEPDSRRMLPERLRELGVTGPDVGRLQREGAIETDGRVVRLDQVSAPRGGQSVAFVMDTRRCDAVGELAEGVDMFVCESTFLDSEADLARTHGHMTAAEAATVAREAGVRLLVLTHFSQRYTDPQAFRAEARRHFDGEIVVAADLDRVPVPRRR